MPQLTISLDQAIELVCEADAQGLDEESIISAYVGRGSVEPCLAIQTSGAPYQLLALGAAFARVFDNVIPADVRLDSLGHSQVVYFPQIQVLDVDI